MDHYSNFRQTRMNDTGIPTPYTHTYPAHIR